MQRTTNRGPGRRLASMLLAVLALLPVFALGTGNPAQAATKSPAVFLGYWALWGDDAKPAASLSANVDRIDLFSPYWFTLRGDGSLGSRESGRDALTAKVQDQGHLVIPLINKTSDDTPLVDSGVRRKAVDNIYRLLVDNDYDGVNIDFEGMEPYTRAGVTAFMEELWAKLKPAGLLVTMAVPAKWSADDSTNDFAACFDYAALGRVVDYLVIMTYDQHAGWSGPGPVADINWVRDTVEYTLTVVPPAKVLLGLGGYGYDWSDGRCLEVEAATVPAEAAQRGATIEWDATAKVPYYVYYSAGGARHEVWYENSYSVDHKIALVNEYGLGGVALWALGQEESRFWQVINGTAGVSGGLAAGGSGGATGPGGGSDPPGGGSEAFDDVPAGYWAYADIVRLAGAGMVSGVDARHFQPERPIDRAEFAALLTRVLGLPWPLEAPTFQDVTPADWFYDPVIRAAGFGLMVGVDSNVFGPFLHLTRQEAAVVSTRVAGNLAVGFSPATVAFNDTSLIAAWALPSVHEAAAKGILAGFPDGSFRPTDSLSRAQAAALLGRLRP
jgi:spore germination protein